LRPTARLPDSGVGYSLAGELRMPDVVQDVVMKAYPDDERIPCLQLSRGLSQMTVRFLPLSSILRAG
jgi:hypothetical protein